MPIYFNSPSSNILTLKNIDRVYVGDILIYGKKKYYQSSS